MIDAALGLLLATVGSFGAPYPYATLDGAIDHQRCATRYALSTSDPIAKVALFYEAQATAANVHLLDDSAGKFSDYRTLTFVSQPRFMFVLIDRKAGQTNVRVAYSVTVPPGCK